MLIMPQGRHDDLPCSPHLVWGDETGDGDPKQPHGSFSINQFGKQRAEDGQHLLRQLEALLTATGPGHQLERAPPTDSRADAHAAERLRRGEAGAVRKRGVVALLKSMKPPEEDLP